MSAPCRLVGIAGLVGLLAACDGPTESELKELEAVSGIPLTTTPTPPPIPWATDALPAPVPGRYRARQVVIAFAGAEGAPATVTRTAAEAQALAETLWLEAADGADVSALARRHGDDPTARRGGLIGTFTPGTLHPLLERAVAAVGPGHTGPLVRTPQGMHLVERLELDEVVVGQVTFGFAGAHRAAATRTRDEALALAQQAAEALRAGTTPAEIGADSARDASPLGPRQWPETLEKAARAMAPGQVSDVIETPQGFVVLIAAP